MILISLSVLSLTVAAFDLDAPFSLFKYDVTQEQAVSNNIQKKHVLYLTGITHSSSVSWGVWLNGDFYDPTILSTHFKILAVTPSSVDLHFEAMDSDVTLSLGDGVCTQSGQIYRKFS